MEPIDEKIMDFLKVSRIATVCFSDKNKNPYCINCFYVFEETYPVLIFKSSPGTNHHNFIVPGNRISGTVLPETVNILSLKGIQFTGEIVSEDFIKTSTFAASYYKKYPTGLVIPGYIWCAKLDFIKMTDNALGFGKKISWQATGKTSVKR